MLASTTPSPPGVRGGAPGCRRWSRPAAPGRAAGRLQARGGRPVSSEVEAGRPAVSRTGLPPSPARYCPDRVAFAEQSLVQAGQRPPAAADDPVPQALRRAPEHGKRPVGAHDDQTEGSEQDEPGDAEQGGVDEPGAGRSAGQDGGQCEDGQCQHAADLEQRERGEAADGGVGVEPAVACMVKWAAGRQQMLAGTKGQRPDPASTPRRSPPSSAWPAGPPQEMDEWDSAAWLASGRCSLPTTRQNGSTAGRSKC